MIIEMLFNLFSNIIILGINTIGTVITLPLTIAYEISSYTGTFAYFIGNDLITALISTLTFWFIVKTGFGVLLFIYKLLPFV